MPSRVEVIINAASGLGCSDDTRQALTEAFVSNGVEATFHFAKTGEEIERFAEKAAAFSLKPRRAVWYTACRGR